MENEVLPKSKIVVLGGKVQSVERWVLWNGNPVNTLSIRRTDHGFSVSSEDPQKGGSRDVVGRTLSYALLGFPNAVRGRYIRLFMQSATYKELKQDFPDYEIEIS